MYDLCLVADTQLLRKLPAAFSDGVYEPAGADRPNPIDISDAVMSGFTGFPSHRNKTAFLVFFGKTNFCVCIWDIAYCFPIYNPRVKYYTE